MRAQIADGDVADLYATLVFFSPFGQAVMSCGSGDISIGMPLSGRIQRFLFKICELRKVHRISRNIYHDIFKECMEREAEIEKYDKIEPMLF